MFRRVGPGPPEPFDATAGAAVSRFHLGRSGRRPSKAGLSTAQRSPGTILEGQRLHYAAPLGAASVLAWARCATGTSRARGRMAGRTQAGRSIESTGERRRAACPPPNVEVEGAASAGAGLGACRLRAAQAEVRPSTAAGPMLRQWSSGAAWKQVAGSDEGACEVRRSSVGPADPECPGRNGRAIGLRARWSGADSPEAWSRPWGAGDLRAPALRPPSVLPPAWRVAPVSTSRTRRAPQWRACPTHPASNPRLTPRRPVPHSMPPAAPGCRRRSSGRGGARR